MTQVRRNTEASMLLLAVLIAIGGHALALLGRNGSLDSRFWVNTAVFAAIFFVAHIAVRKLAPAADPLFLPLAAVLSALGFILISRLEGATDNPGLAQAQLRWLAVAVASMILVLYRVKDLRALGRYRYTFAVAGLVLLLLPMVPGLGHEINGSRLWIRLGPLSFQPAELGKIALVLFFAGYLSERRELLAVATRRIGPIGVPEFRHFGPVFLAWAISLLVMTNQKDLGSSLLFFAIFVAMLWMATARPIYLLAGSAMFLVGAAVAAQVFGHVQRRIDVWRDPFADPDAHGFQIVQSLFSLATGGAWGTGLGLGRPDLIPAVTTDFIFAAVGEELGLAGGAAVLTIYAIFASRGFGLATRCRDDFTKLLVAGLATALALQTVLIVGGVTKLIPLTGITLPFMSYGGSSLLSNFILVALLLRASDGSTRAGEAAPTELSMPAGGGR